MAETDPTTERATERPVVDDGIDDERNVTFSLAGVRDGFVTGFPVAVGVAGFGVAFGVIAGRAGLSVAEAALMSATVLAGTAQLVGVELWSNSAPIVAILLTVAVINLRYLLLGAALRPWFRHLSGPAAYASAFFTTDENWALTMATLRSGSTRGAFLLGSGLVLWVLWIVSTVLGVTVGGFLGAPTQYGLDFVVTALFLTLAVGLWEGRASIQPWVAAASVALAVHLVIPGKWYIIVGALAGAGVGMMRYE